MPRLTGRGWALLAVAVLTFSAAELAGYPLLRALAGAELGVVVAAMVAVGRRPRVNVTREVYPDRVRRGRAAFVRLRVHNPGRWPQRGFTAGDQIGGASQTVTVRPLLPGAHAVYHYELPTQARGRYQVGPLILQRTDPLGLGRSRLTTGEVAELWVHPRTHPARTMTAGYPRHHHEGRSSDGPLHGSLDLRDVREYVPGDEVRNLHWKATARTGTLMVRDYVDPDQPRFTVLLDTRAELTSAAVFEEEVDVAASLLAAAAEAGHRCRLVTPHTLDIGVAGGPSGMRVLLDELCTVSAAGGADLPLVPTELTRSKDRNGFMGGSLAVVLSGAGQADLAALAALRGQYSSTVIVAVGQSELDIARPGMRVLRGTTGAEAVRRWNLAVGA